MWWRTQPKKWQYMVLPMLPDDGDDLTPSLASHAEMMNTLGMIGWELVTVFRDCLIFKKPC